MHAVFLDKKTFNDDIELSSITAQLDSLTCFDTTADSEVITRCQNAEIILTNKVVLNQDILTQLPKLKLICITATGTNNVDLKSAKALGIAVTNVSGYAKGSVAQYVFAQLLEYFNQTSHHNANTKQGLWQQSETFCHLGNDIVELANKTIAIVGYGNLGQSVADIAKAFNMKVLIAERPQANVIRAGRVAFEQAIKQADVLTLHCPQTPDTEELINKKVFELMKPTAMLINTARGALVNNEDLIAALKNSEIAYAALDVLEQEPPPVDHPLLNCQLPNLKITAHIAWASMEAQQRLIKIVADNITDFYHDGHLNRVD